MVAYAIRKGVLTRQPCERCGDPDTVAHHEDYDRPLDVVWLCRTHHIERHIELGDFGESLHPIWIRLEDADRAALERAARADDRTISALGRKIVAEWLVKNGWLKVPKGRRP